MIINCYDLIKTVGKHWIKGKVEIGNTIDIGFSDKHAVKVTGITILQRWRRRRKLIV